MKKYTSTPKDPLNNMHFHGTEKEEFLDFFGNHAEPLSVEKIGITYPDENYSISRSVCSYIVLECILDGKGYVEVDGICYEVTPNDVYLLMPGTAHKYWADAKQPFKKIWINFFSDVFFDLIHKLQLNNSIVFHAYPETNELFHKLLSHAQNNSADEFFYADLSIIIYNIIIQLYKCNSSFLQNDNIDIATATLNLLNFYVYDNPTLENLSKMLLVSEEYIIKQFKKKYGVTPHRYLLDKKIGIAKNRLHNTTDPIREISRQLGFENEHYFSKIFKQKTGSSPSQYRSSITKSDVPPRKFTPSS